MDVAECTRLDANALGDRRLEDLAQLGQLDRCTVHQSKSHSAWVQRVPPIDPPPLSSQSKLENTDCKSAVVEVYISFSAHPRQILE